MGKIETLLEKDIKELTVPELLELNEAICDYLPLLEKQETINLLLKEKIPEYNYLLVKELIIKEKELQKCYNEYRFPEYDEKDLPLFSREQIIKFFSEESLSKEEQEWLSDLIEDFTTILANFYKANGVLFSLTEKNREQRK